MQLSFFDLENRYIHLSKSGDPLERLDRAIDWELFRPTLEQVDNKARKSAAGRKPTDRVRMFKMLILQSKYNLSDDQLEYQVTDRLSFARFIGVDLSGDVPDAKTVWIFRESLKEAGLWEGLLLRFDEALLGLGVKLNSGQIVDASFVPVPIQRNKSEENERIKAGEMPA
jgi:IS5 family transposase